jgi:methylated-DNA-[protein]-cysteine S-methyltransferase
MSTASYTLFSTAIGPCAVAWTERGICAVQLPDKDEEKTSLRLRARLPSAEAAIPTGDVALAIGVIREHLAGKAQDLSRIRLDTSGLGSFDARIYELARSIPAGRTVTYGELARRAGSPGAARAVGVSMGRNPWPIIVPCHRVVAKGGTGGFSAPGGLVTKKQLLAAEGVALEPPTTQPLFASDGALPFHADAAVPSSPSRTGRLKGD